MKKSLLKMTFAAAAMFMASTASAEVTEPTLTQDWTTTENIPAVANARYGAGFGEKIYINDKSAKELYCYSYDENTQTVSRTVISGVSATAMGMGFDAKGNAAILTGWAGGGAMRSFLIWNSTTNETATINIESVLSNLGVTATRMDYLGRGVGDIFGDGGAFFLCTNTTTPQIVKVYIANGAVVEDKCTVISAESATSDSGNIAVALTEDPESDKIAFRNRNGKNFKIYDGANWTTLTGVGNVSTTAGGDVVRLSGDLYTIEPAGATHYGGWQIVNRTTNTVVATVEAGSVNNTNGATALCVEKISDTKAYIYHVHPGAFVAKYTFEVPAPAPLYVIGSCQGWDPANGLEMTYYDGAYTIENVEFTDGGNFSFTTVKGNNSSDWASLSGNRYGFAKDNDIAANNTTMDIVKGEGAIQVPFGGVYTITADINALTVKVSGKGKTPDPLPEELFVIGNLDDSGSWDPSNGIELTKVEDGVFTGEVELYEVHDQNGVGSGWAYFALATALGNNSSDWDTMNASPRFGAESTDHEIATPEGASLIMTETQSRSWKVLAHNETLFTITVNFNDMTVKLDSYTGIEDVEVAEEDVPAVYYNLQGVEVVNPAKGNIYIVKRGNKITKELK